MIRPEEQTQWFVMRDLKRPNAKLPAYKLLEEEHVEVFVPMKSRVVTMRGVKQVKQIPAIPDLLFAHATTKRLDPIVARTRTLQYRILRNSNRTLMTVSEEEMKRFICAVESSRSVRYYMPEEITPEMYGRKIRIVGGMLDGYEGSLLSVRGSKKRRVLVNLQNFFTAGVEVNPEYIQLI